MDQTLEHWIPVSGYEGLYAVSNHGQVRSLDRTVTHPRLGSQAVMGRILKHWALQNGYAQVKLSKDGRKLAFCIHRLVLCAFVGECPNGMVAAHYDGNPLNNHVSNLRWTTQADNINDKRRHGTIARGERAGNSRLSEEVVRQIRADYRRGNGAELMQRFGISQSTVSCIVNRKTWKHV